MEYGPLSFNAITGQDQLPPGLDRLPSKRTALDLLILRMTLRKLFITY